MCCCCSAGSRRSPSTLPAWLQPASAAAVPALALLLTLWGLVNARRTARVVRVDVPIAQLPAALHGFSIAQISDLHVGPTIKHGYLQAIVERVNALQADMVAITGDLVDGSVQQLAAHVAPLAGLQSRHGSFFVTGNHEYYSGAPAWLAELRRLGLRVLLNEHVLLRHDGASLALAGRGRLQRPPLRSRAPQRSAGAPLPAWPPKPACACCWRISRAVRPRRRRQASICSCRATPMAGSSCRGIFSCACSSRLRPG